MSQCKVMHVGLIDYSELLVGVNVGVTASSVSRGRLQ